MTSNFQVINNSRKLLIKAFEAYAKENLEGKSTCYCV